MRAGGNGFAQECLANEARRGSSEAPCSRRAGPVIRARRMRRYSDYVAFELPASIIAGLLGYQLRKPAGRVSHPYASLGSYSSGRILRTRATIPDNGGLIGRAMIDRPSSVLEPDDRPNPVLEKG